MPNEGTAGAADRTSTSFCIVRIDRCGDAPIPGGPPAL